MSIVDPASLPTLAEALERGDDPTSFVEVGHLGDSIADAVAIADADRPQQASAARAMAARFAKNPPPDGDNRPRVLGVLWEAELIENPGLVDGVIDAVTDSAARAELVVRRQDAIELGERSGAGRGPAPGAQWYPLDQWNVELFATESGNRLDDQFEDLVRATTQALQGFGPELEALLRPLLPDGVDVQVRVGQ